MKKIFYKLFILGGLFTSTTLISTSKSNKKEFFGADKVVQKTPTPPQEKSQNTETKKDEPLLSNTPTEEIILKENKNDPQVLLSTLKTIAPGLKKYFTFRPPKIQLPTREEVQNFIDTQKQLLNEEKKVAQYSFLRHLMAPTYLVESTLCSVDSMNIVHSKPMECFYFCTSNALTIGYGLKIEFNGDKLAPEGIEALKSLDIKINGRSLSQSEKEKLAYQCIQRRNEYNKNHSPNLSQMRYEAQVGILFPQDKPIISKENALAAAQIEYTDKHAQLLKRNPFLGRSIYSQALGTDLAYQYGNFGVTRCNYYKNAQQKVLSSQISIGSGDRLKIRKFLCALAYKHHQNQVKRKSNPITQEEQNAFTLFAIQKYFELFKTSIMERSAYHILLMEKMLTLVMMQHQQDIQDIPLLSQQIEECEKKAHQLVYNDLFHSETIKQLPKRIQPITMVDALKNAQTNLKPWIKSNKLSLTPEIFMGKILFSEAEKKIALYNKKHKKNIAIKKPAKETNIVATTGTQR